MSKITKPLFIAGGGGRIGSNLFRALENQGMLGVIGGISDLLPPKKIAHQLHYGGPGTSPLDIKVGDSSLTINGHEIPVHSAKAIGNAAHGMTVAHCWGGPFLDPSTWKGYQQELGFKHCVFSAPPKNGEGLDQCFHMMRGVRDNELETALKSDTPPVFYDNASCTTNSLAATAKVATEQEGFVGAFMSTTHALTVSNASPVATNSAAPSSTGAATALARVVPGMTGKFPNAFSVRFPGDTGSVSHFNIAFRKGSMTAEKFAAILKGAAEARFKGVLGIWPDFGEAPGTKNVQWNPHSAMFVPEQVSGYELGDNYIVVVNLYYDNEWGYPNRMAENLRVILRHSHSLEI